MNLIGVVQQAIMAKEYEEREEKLREEEQKKEKDVKIIQEEKIMEEITESFKIFDIDGDGVISAYEVQCIMNSVGKKITLEDAEIIVEILDENEGDCINFKEFKALMYEKMAQETVEEDLLDCFSILDSDDDGFVTPTELQELFEKVGELISFEEALEVMALLDTKNDGLIDYEEFRDYCCKMLNLPNEKEEVTEGDEKSSNSDGNTKHEN